MCRCAGIVQGGENTRRTLLFDQVAHNLVVEVVDRCPFDLLPHIFFLLGLEGELDEDLLQLLVDIVDAQLLERIVLAARNHISGSHYLRRMSYKISKP